MHQIAAAKKKEKVEKIQENKKMRARNNFVAWACLEPSPCNSEGSITLNPGPHGISPLFAGRYFDVDSTSFVGAEISLLYSRSSPSDFRERLLLLEPWMRTCLLYRQSL